MPDIPEVPISGLGSLFAKAKNAKERLEDVAPVISAKCIDYDRDENAYLIRLEVFPAKRQYRYTDISVEGCLIMKVVEGMSDGYQNNSTFVWPSIEYSPDKAQGVFRSLSLDAFIVPPEASEVKPKTTMFYVLPEYPMKFATIHLKSAQWFSSLSCDVALDED